MIAVDAVVRRVSVYSDYKNGGNLQRSISTELASFGAATATGIYVGTVTTTALSSLLMLTPYGVIALGVGLYVGFAASNEMSKFMKKTSENIYDRKPIFEGVF